MNSKTTLECHNALNTLSDTNTVHVLSGSQDMRGIGATKKQMN